MGQQGPEAEPAIPRLPSRLFPVVAVAVALWAAIPPFAGPALHVARRVEIADHVVPAGVIAVVSGFTIAFRDRGSRDSVGLVAGVIVTLAGLWMTTTHVPLLAQAIQRRAPVPAALWHTTPGVVVLFLGALWVLQANRVNTDRVPRRAGAPRV
ncbi:MAG: hypothetical protein NVSMB16_08790 [Acidimicrobiales bacterium]